MKKRAERRLPGWARTLVIAALSVLLVLALGLVVTALLTAHQPTPPPMSDEVSQEAQAMKDREIELRLKGTALREGFEQATREQERYAAGLFERLLAEGTSPALLRKMYDLGFVVEKRTPSEGVSLIFVRESPERSDGKGFYVILESGRPVLLQAPHRYKDVGTGLIVARLMEEHNFRAAGWNTVPRWYEGTSGRIDADLAHIEASHFNAFGIAFARVFPEARVVQIHGFSRDKRNTASGRSANIIVSSGTHRPGDAAGAIADCLASTLTTETVLLYPTQVRELGATTNTNAQALRKAGFENFVHIELSREIRDTLLVDPDLRARFAESIAGC